MKENIIISNDLLEIEYSYYVKNFLKENTDEFNLKKYNEVKDLLIKRKSKYIQVKPSKKEELSLIIKNKGISFKNENQLLNIVNSIIIGNSVSLSDLSLLLEKNFKKLC